MNIKIKELITCNIKRTLLFSLYAGDTVPSFLVCCRSEPTLSTVTTQGTHSLVMHYSSGHKESSALCRSSANALTRASHFSRHNLQNWYHQKGWISLSGCLQDFDGANWDLTLSNRSRELEWRPGLFLRVCYIKLRNMLHLSLNKDQSSLVIHRRLRDLSLSLIWETGTNILEEGIPSVFTLQPWPSPWAIHVRSSVLILICSGSKFLKLCLF
jgi:hypothetical protein